ncbi:hypothetical protein ACFWM1_05415 [Nocardia sp. NPDC058379]|uniref:hypothetical protein n=1 Tax=unclassified Nocardia TaxID=2637762 RepID=UPI00366161FB
MTSVRQAAEVAATRKRMAEKKRGATRRETASSLGPSRLAQVRLRADEVAALQEVMRTLHIGSTSDALREGLRLLAREAAEVGAAEEIRAFYASRPAPLPEGVVEPDADELAAVDEMQW